MTAIKEHERPVPQADRIMAAEGIRGIAALLVTLFHLTSDPVIAKSPIFSAFANWGWLGVQVFFIVSGLVIPIAAARGTQDFRGAMEFLGRRLTRLALPYWATIALILLLGWASSIAPGFRGGAFEIPSPTVMACHFTYSCGAFEASWLNPAFWTLAIEFQFYVAVALVLCIRSERAKWLFVASMMTFAMAIGTMDVPVKIFAYAHYFACGIVVWAALAGHLKIRNAVAGIILIAGFTLYRDGLAHVVVVVSTVSAVMAWRAPGRPWIWLGGISYSLYLIHIPIGGRVINLGFRLDPGPVGSALLVLLALAICVLAAHVFCRTIEQPAQRLARNMFRTAVSRKQPTLAQSVQTNMSASPHEAPAGQERP